MTLVATQAARELQADMNAISPHRVIALLLQGALERIDQAKACVADGRGEDLDQLVQKTVGILNGLRASLDFERGGALADNLDAVYDYVAANISEHPDQPTFQEAQKLLTEIKIGWDGIEQLTVDS